MNLRFHWMLPKGGEVGLKSVQETNRVLTTRSTSLAGTPDMDGWTRFARCAEESGIDSVLLSFSRFEPDTIVSACALGRATERLRYIVAFRSCLMQPTMFVQQLNTLSTLIDGRVAVNIVAGSSPEEQRGYGDYLGHDERYARTEEFLSICHALWQDGGPVDFKGDYLSVEQARLHTRFAAPQRTFPEIYVAGHSEPAKRLAIKHGTSWLRLIDTPETLGPQVAGMREQGTEVTLRLAIVARPTRADAIEAAHAMLPDDDTELEERRILTNSDSRTLHDALDVANSKGWLNDHVWTGFVPCYGSSAVALVGSFDDLAGAFVTYKRIGVTQFIISGWPKLDEMVLFSHEVLPRVRAAEKDVVLRSCSAPSAKRELPDALVIQNTEKSTPGSVRI